ncbi:hypothetical protein LWI29_021063 [Acer saccharum]|uniref:Uncharacterized protein n=1 Tax=Acer saccharum TaxID=4024 RepID=A0AA39TTJ9_ACESA|nr:hypothetical protein LWI29_021063 [Acer saccharum]
MQEMKSLMVQMLKGYQQLRWDRDLEQRWARDLELISLNQRFHFIDGLNQLRNKYIWFGKTRGESHCN